MKTEIVKGNGENRSRRASGNGNNKETETKEKLELRVLGTQIEISEASFNDRMQEMEKNFSLKSKQKKWVLGQRKC